MSVINIPNSSMATKEDLKKFWETETFETGTDNKILFKVFIEAVVIGISGYSYYYVKNNYDKRNLMIASIIIIIINIMVGLFLFKEV